MSHEKGPSGPMELVSENGWSTITRGTIVRSEGFEICIPAVVHVRHNILIPTPYFIHMTGPETHHNFKNRVGTVSKAQLFVGLGRHQYWNTTRMQNAERISSRFAADTRITTVQEFTNIQLHGKHIRFYMNTELVDESITI